MPLGRCVEELAANACVWRYVLAAILGLRALTRYYAKKYDPLPGGASKETKEEMEKSD